MLTQFDDYFHKVVVCAGGINSKLLRPRYAERTSLSAFVVLMEYFHLNTLDKAWNKLFGTNSITDEEEGPSLIRGWEEPIHSLA